MKNPLGKIEEKPYGGAPPPPLVRPRVNQKIINYFLFLHNKGNGSIVKQIFLMSADLHSSGKSSFFHSVTTEDV